ncbi:MAG: hypothetical protein QOH95_751, partial [Gaiellaceae bacterium]|nr:hypothetical protein [Gaiellaceae bacterium]
MRRVVCAALIATLAGLATGTAARGEPPQVTVIGDSVLTAVIWNDKPLATIQQGLDMRLDIGVCRRLAGVSCPYEGGNVPTLLDVVHGLGPNLGKVVLVEMGYNDDAATFAQNVEASIAALLRGGAQRILWANLRGFSQHWIDMNDVLDEAAHRHPELTIVDWDSYSSNRWSWFQGDGIHLVYEGAMAMATLFNSAIRQALAAPATVAETPAPLAVDTPALPAARVGHAYLARLVATGGSAP